MCHAALFLLDASKTGTRTEQIELNYLYDYAPHVFFVLSKWDLVRNAHPDMTMDEIKIRYLDSIGKITHDARNGETVSAEGIYVVSAKEGLEAVEKCHRYIHNQKKKKKPIKDIRYVDFLRDKGKSNEIFDLFFDMYNILDEKTKKSMIRLRPLLTMSNLAKSELERLDQKLAHDVDTSELDLNIARVSNDLENRKKAILKRNQAIVDRLVTLANAEQKELSAWIESRRKPVLSDISASLQKTAAFQTKNTSQLFSSAFHRSFQNQMNDILMTRILSPLQEKVNSFLTLLNNSFDSGEELTVNMPAQALPHTDFSIGTRKTQQITDSIQKLKDTQTSIENEISNLEKQYSASVSDFENCRKAKEKVQEIDKKIAEKNAERAKMGNRPGADPD